MPATSVILATGNNPASSPTVTVWTKAKWSDDWVETPDLWLDEVRWSVSPTLPTATFTYRYGLRYDPTSSVYVAKNRTEWSRKLVKVRVSMSGAGSKRWYGIIDAHADEQGGTKANKATGSIRITAYGLEKLLDDHAVANHWTRASWLDNDDLKCDGSPDFNAGGVGNRTSSKDSRPVYVFAKPKPKPDEAATSFWTTKDIVEYALELLSPTDDAGVKAVPLSLAAGAWLPDFDKSVVPAVGRTTKNLIDGILARQRGVCWWLEVNDDETKVELKTATLALDDVDLGAGATLPAASRQVELQCQSDVSAQLSIHSASTDQFDQVVVRGSRRTTTMTLKADVYGTIAKGWTDASQTAYNAGAANGATVEQKQRADKAWRGRPELRSVYAWFKLPDEWTQTDDSSSGSGAPAFVQANGTSMYKASPVELRIAPQLALEQEADYSVDTTTTGGKTVRYRPIAVFIPVGSTKWFLADSLGRSGSLGYERPEDNSEIKWSASARVIDKPTGSVIEFTVSGSDQHAIAKSEFTPAGGHDTAIHKHDWKKFQWTVTIEEDRHCEAVFPDTLASKPVVRRLVIDAGDKYRLDRLLKNTVIGVNADGTLKRSPSTSRYVRDDRERLAFIARMAYSWYVRTRRAIQLQTHIVRFADSGSPGGADLRLGDYIKSVGNPAATGDDFLATNSTLTEITVTHGHSQNGTPPPISIRYATDFAQLDPAHK